VQGLCSHPTTETSVERRKLFDFQWFTAICGAGYIETFPTDIGPLPFSVFPAGIRLNRPSGAPFSFLRLLQSVILIDQALPVDCGRSSVRQNAFVLCLLTSGVADWLRPGAYGPTELAEPPESRTVRATFDFLKNGATAECFLRLHV
jgi:hypothetical protein